MHDSKAPKNRAPNGISCVGCGCDDPRVLMDFRLGELALPLCHNCCHLVRSSGVTTREGLIEVAGRHIGMRGRGDRQRADARRGTIADRFGGGSATTTRAAGERLV